MHSFARNGRRETALHGYDRLDAVAGNLRGIGQFENADLTVDFPSVCFIGARALCGKCQLWTSSKARNLKFPIAAPL